MSARTMTPRNPTGSALLGDLHIWDHLGSLRQKIQNRQGAREKIPSVRPPGAKENNLETGPDSWRSLARCNRMPSKFNTFRYNIEEQKSSGKNWTPQERGSDFSPPFSGDSSFSVTVVRLLWQGFVQRWVSHPLTLWLWKNANKSQSFCDHHSQHVHGLFIEASCPVMSHQNKAEFNLWDSSTICPTRLLYIIYIAIWWTWVTVTANFETAVLCSSMHVSCSQPVSACKHITNKGRKNQPPIIPIHPRHCFPTKSGDLPYRCWRMLGSAAKRPRLCLFQKTRAGPDRLDLPQEMRPPPNRKLVVVYLWQNAGQVKNPPFSWAIHSSSSASSASSNPHADPDPDVILILILILIVIVIIIIRPYSHPQSLAHSHCLHRRCCHQTAKTGPQRC